MINYFQRKIIKNKTVFLKCKKIILKNLKEVMMNNVNLRHWSLLRMNRKNIINSSNSNHSKKNKKN